MKNITYLFGAGASCNCLPTYKNFRERFKDFIEFIDKHKVQNTIKALKKEIDSLHQELCDVENNLAFHNTPDTLAKKLYHLNDTDKLESLKIALILFFIYEQIFVSENLTANEKTSIDLRYDSFIAATLKPIPAKVEFIDNINILTWNYDLQFEIAYSRYINKTIPEIQQQITFYPLIGLNNNSDKKGFSISHLNGVAYAHPNLINSDLIGHFIEKQSIVIEYLLNLFKNFKENKSGYKDSYLKLLSFAWENTNADFSLNETKTFNHAKAVAAKTNVLVINGYSFPIFNRVIDVELLKEMKLLKKIYIQSPNANDIKSILEEISTIEGVRFKKDIIFDLGYYSQFYIPDLLHEEKKGKLLVSF